MTNNSINELLQEQYNARTDYNKKQHESLDDRLNADMSEVHKRFNQASLLEYEGEYITATNSYKGSTEELKLKGRTLQNLYRDNPKVEGSTEIGYFYCLNIHLIQNLSNKIVTLINTTDKVMRYDFRNVDNTNINASSINVPAHGSVKTTMGENRKIHDVLGLTSEGWTDANKTELKGYVLEGDWTNKPIQPYFEGIKSVGGDKLEVLSCGKNLFDFNYWSECLTAERGLISNVTNNSFTMSSTGKDCYTNTYSGTNKKLIKVKPSTDYSLSFSKNSTVGLTCVFFYSELHEFTYSKFETSLLKNFTFTTPKECNYISIRFGINLPGLSETFSDIQLEEGTTSTPYEPYTEDKSEILLQDLKGLNDNICDILDMESGKLTRNIGKIVLNGSETDWTLQTSANNTNNCIVFNYCYYNIKKLEANRISTICDKFTSKTITDTWNTDIEGIAQAGNGQYLQLRILKNKLASLDVVGLKTWLKANPVTVYYQLATPIVESIEGTHQLRIYDGTTHMWTEGSLISPTIQCKVPSNVNAVVQGLRSNVSTLSAENARLNNSVEENTLNSIRTNVNQEERLTILEMGVK